MRGRFEHRPRKIDHHDIKQIDKSETNPQQALHLVPPHLQAGGNCRRSQLSTLLPLQPQAVKTRVHLETDGSGALVPSPVSPVIDATICSGCGRCVSACPLRLITLEAAGYRKTAVLRNAGLCTMCRECIKACLLKALSEPVTGREKGK
jgi:ferredoxin